MPYQITADLPQSVLKALDTATSRYLFLGILNKGLAEGASETVAFAKAWAGMERAGYAEHPDGAWRRCAPAERAEIAKQTAMVKLAARADKLAAIGKKAMGMDTLYICRPLVNASDLRRWALDQGFTSTLPLDEMHATIAYSHAYVQHSLIPPAPERLVIEGGRRAVFPLGEDGAVVLGFEGKPLHSRWSDLRELGASWDYDGYRPHVTITYSPPHTFDARSIVPYTGPLIFGPEQIKPINYHWDGEVAEVAKYNPTQSRDRMGRWSAGGFGAPMAPQLGGKPDTFMVKDPTMASDVDTNDNPEDVATYTSDFDPGEGLNGVPFEPWKAPTTDEGWAKVEGQKDVGEPDFPDTGKKRPASGVIIEEPDGRVWLIEPTNHFGGYEHTFPKGGLERGMSAQANAIKETYEEAGLKVEITGYVGDFERTTSVARYYTAKRVGGSPADHGTESQSVKLVPKADLAEYANHSADAPILSQYLGITKAAISAAQEEFAKKGGWNKQVRAPAGTPIGGQWIANGVGGISAGMSLTYGEGTLGSYVAALGKDLKLQTLSGKNMDHPDIVKGNKAAELFQAKANAGDYQFFKDMDASGKAPKPSAGTYSSKTHANYQEAKAYAKTKQRGSMGLDNSAGGAKADPKPKGAVAGEPDMKLSNLYYEAPKPGGSAQGAIYADANGQKWLVKGYPEADQARQEVLAAGLYRAAGAEAPEMKLIDLEGSYGAGGVGVMSKWYDSSMPLNPNSGSAYAATKDFGADAWLANWDSVGASYDNIRLVQTPDGMKASRVDPGGSLDYRAMGNKKGDAFDTKASEWTTLRDPSVNQQSAKIYGPMGDADLKASAAKVAAVDDATIKALTAKNLPEPAASKMADKLIARRDAIAAQAGLDTAHAKAPGKLDDATINSPAAKAGSPAAGGDLALQNVKPLTEADFPSSTTSGFYAKQSEKLANAAKAGDMVTVEKMAGYTPSSAAGKNSPNFHLYQAQAQTILNGMKVKAATVPAHMGPKSKPAKTKAVIDAEYNELFSGTAPATPKGPPPAKLTVNPANKDAAVVQKKYDTVDALGAAGDVDGLLALNYSTATSGKAMAKKTNEWMVHHGYEPKAFPGMNVKSDPNAGQHKATASGLGATPKPVLSEAPKLNAQGGNPQPPKFNPSLLKPAPDFTKDFSGQGANDGPGLSSKDWQNKANNVAVNEIANVAKTGDLTTIKALKVPLMDESGMITKMVPAGEHPSQHVKAFFADMEMEVDLQLNPPRPMKLVNVKGTKLGAIAEAVPVVPSGKAVAAFKSNKKAGDYLVLGKVDDPLPKPKTSGGKIMDGADWQNTVKKQISSQYAGKQSFFDYVESAGAKKMNESLRKTGDLDATYNGKTVRQHVKDMESVLVDIPEGASFTRWMGKSGYGATPDSGKLAQLENFLIKGDPVGVVLQETGFTSSSYKKQILSNNNIKWKLTAGPGVKAVPGWLGLNAGEGEALFPPNTRYMIKGAKQVKNANGKMYIEAEAVLLPFTPFAES